MKEKTYLIDLETDYGQFYIVNNLEDYEDIHWDNDSLNKRMLVANGIIAVIIASRYYVQGEIAVLGKAPALDDLDKYDHVVEGGIDVINNQLYFLDCPNSEVLLKIPIPNGSYRVRVYTMNSKNIMGDCFEKEEDRYRIEIFPGTSKEVVVYKRMIE